jgi:hypothetical protein
MVLKSQCKIALLGRTSMGLFSQPFGTLRLDSRLKSSYLVNRWEFEFLSSGNNAHNFTRHNFVINNIIVIHHPNEIQSIEVDTSIILPQTPKALYFLNRQEFWSHSTCKTLNHLLV